MKFKKLLTTAMAAALAVSAFAGCGAPAEESTETAQTAESTGEYADTITLVWYPNESAEDYDVARSEYARLIEEATGKKVEQKLTTDYAIAIESLANGTAQICFMGAQGYIEAKNANDAIEPLFVNSGASGTLDDAKYYRGSMASLHYFSLRRSESDRRRPDRRRRRQTVLSGTFRWFSSGLCIQPAVRQS